MSTRKDDPVFNVKFVQLVESKPCLWNSTLPEYSKKDEIQKAWQEVANDTKDTVRNCRERWRTIRSSFLRSLKLSRTTTGRGKRKYYLSKYLQFLIPYTKTRIKNSASIIAQRKVAASGNIPPMTRVSNMPTVSSDNTKDSTNSADVAAIAESDVVVSSHEGGVIGNSIAQSTWPKPLNLQNIKQEQDVLGSGDTQTSISVAAGPTTSFNTSVSFAANENRSCLNSSGTTTMTTPVNNLSSASGIKGNSFTSISRASNNPSNPTAVSNSFQQLAADSRNPSGSVDLSDLAEWLKYRNDHQRSIQMTTAMPPDADQFFLNSLLPYLKEMSGKQNRRFRQKVVALIDNILDNADEAGTIVLE
uniref:Alcohol dehydrogenase transcription factor n=1 Tax=Musca domestica TaxID=7370 RepID=T1P956_MUSDO